jgi:hypothetical protein
MPATASRRISLRIGGENIILKNCFQKDLLFLIGLFEDGREERPDFGKLRLYLHSGG